MGSNPARVNVFISFLFTKSRIDQCDPTLSKSWYSVPNLKGTFDEFLTPKSV